MRPCDIASFVTYRSVAPCAEMPLLFFRRWIIRRPTPQRRRLKLKGWAEKDGAFTPWRFGGERWKFPGASSLTDLVTF